tara:strand:+ start:1737 stop:2363 length:627 start_codon:yes stop_codon:yes gene_type:complete
MNLSNYYWYFQSAIPHRICDNIITHGLSKKDSLARIGGFEQEKLSLKEMNDMKTKRNSDITWLQDSWIYREIQPYVHIANKNAGWNFDWNFTESCQFTKYKLNQYYDWHCDTLDTPYDNSNHKNYYGKIRKLSMTCQLTDSSEYQGGELEFDLRNKDPDKKPNIRTCTEILPKGSIVVFPSHVWHRVKAVTKGVRYSLVAWHLGYPFK